MEKRLNIVIEKLERIPVSGINAILMGESLKELLILREMAQKQEEGEEECQP